MILYKKNLLFLILFALIGCGEKPIISVDAEVDDQWPYEKSMDFDFSIANIDASYDMFLSLEYAPDFGYQNLYVNIETNYPKGSKTEDVVSLNLTDGMGSFLGGCNSTRCVTDILLRENFKLQEKGDYQLKIYQHSREKNLEGVIGGKLKIFKRKD